MSVFAGNARHAAHPHCKAGFTKFMQDGILRYLYLGVNNNTSLVLLVGYKRIDIKVYDFWMIDQ